MASGILFVSLPFFLAQGPFARHIVPEGDIIPGGDIVPAGDIIPGGDIVPAGDPCGLSRY
jgi:hypothetical protein